MPREIELKLSFPADARKALLDHPLIASAQRLGRAQTLINTYFDTPDMKLSARRIALRTRKAGRKEVQTVKCAAISSGGLSSRPEWEYAYHGSFDFGGIDNREVKEHLEKHCARIEALFTTNFRRETFVLSPKAGVRILVMLDVGEIQAQGRAEPIHELELELAEGSVEDILELACQLARELPLLPYDPSKAERGYRLYWNQPSALPRVSDVSIPDFDLPTLDIFCHLAQENLRIWAACQYAAPHQSDPECIHQLRLSLRQLRNLIRLFSPVLPTAFTKKWPRILATLADTLANARDLDVLCEEILPQINAHAPSAYTEVLFEHARQASQDLNSQIKRELSAPGKGEPLLAFMQDLQNLPAPVKQPPARKLGRTTVQQTLELANKRLQRAQSSPTAENLHRLRISIKRLRHTLDVFMPLFSGKSNQKMLGELGRLQRSLGLQHDLHVALPQLQAWRAQNQKLGEAIAFASGWLTATNLQLESSIVPDCTKILRHKYWRELR